jgi:hypothetical protein
MNRIHRIFIAALAIVTAAIITVLPVAAVSCDMTEILRSSPDGAELTDDERDELERTGHFLKLASMPLHTQITNVASAQIANSVSAIAGLDKNQRVRIFRDANSASVYIPLAYSDNSEFTESGSFYVAFAVHVDALASYTVGLADKVIVPFTDGCGELDVRSLPVSGPGGPNETPDLTEDERAELERTGRFLKLASMPPNTQSSNVVSVQNAKSASSVAGLDKNQSVRIFRDTGTGACSVYLPLVYSDNSEFTENGSFYVAFAIHVDAVSSYVITVSDKILVAFSDGRGELDIRMLPYEGTVAADRRYLTVYNLPLNMLPQNVSNVSVNNRSGPVAACADYSLVDVSVYGGSSSVSIPISLTNSSKPFSVFSGTGSFYVSFEIFIDAVTHYSVTAEDRVLVYFLNGNGYLDINELGSAAAAKRRYLTVTGLPPNTLPRHVSSVMIHNQAGPVARAEDYGLIDVLPSLGGAASARIPLCYISPPGAFSGSGGYFVVFDINIDADTRFTVAAQDRVIVSFLDGNGSFDVADIPAAALSERRYLTITGLPSNLLAQNVSGVSVRNQDAAVAQCEDYKLIEVSLSGGVASARIPLASASSVFTGTGIFVVTFDINIDADTRFTVAAGDNVKVPFTNGSGTLDIKNIPEKPVPGLTLRNLPPHTARQHISNVAVYNLAGAVASCENYSGIAAVSENGRVTAKVPLSSVGGYFQDTGLFYISFTVSVDIENNISVSRSDNIFLNFTGGSATFDVFSTYGYFSAELANPSDTAIPVIKAGSEFEIDGYRHKISSDLTVRANTPDSFYGIIYLYAFRVGTEVFYEFSPAAPAFNASKNGYYNGYKRALWKMVYLDGGTLFLFKTRVADNFPQFANFVISNFASNELTDSKSPYYSLSGGANPAGETVILPPGVYVVKLNGAGGGGGYGSTGGSSVSGSSPGGDGGSVIEIMTLGAATPFTAFAGSGGYAPAGPASPSGQFCLYGTENKLRQNFRIEDTETTSYEYADGPSSVVPADPLRRIPLHAAVSGGGGGGGGAASFLYSGQGYFLCAGGGGGGSGGSRLTPGGAGGSGGAIGSGGVGGAAGFLRPYYGSSVDFTASGGNGGNGGGAGGGSGGKCEGPQSNINPISNFNGGAGAAALTDYTAYAEAAGSPSYQDSQLAVPPSVAGSISVRIREYYGYSTISAPALNVAASNFLRSDTGGNGGPSPSVSYVAPNDWLNTKNSAGLGARVPPLASISYSGSISWTTNDARINNFYQQGYHGFTNEYSLRDYNLSNLNVVIPSAAGVAGPAGGNNRNSDRGGGSRGGTVSNSLPSNGTAGFVAVYKIH